ncbi:hypothetical protein PPTG_18567 [Phytophthora nicotianae INRA-310]|uniref:Uncharacterized protein n=1 Tax=Phytophthora nicotianae (strain INRA-310) TaxID=761204 RepID=W2PFD2_PHYN3|nr:hypothetical protein PPTG_18567 [Phytophthora nicotianae INRA-310]ETM99335.1 hypothetical protein PPTG_18567 [Phytophthora nicotianae INRA-310]
MGCCSSKPTPGKERTATTPEVATIEPPTVSVDQVKPIVIDNAVEDMHMDCDNEKEKSDDEEPQPEDDEPALLGKDDTKLDEVLVHVRSPERAVPVQSPPSPPPQKLSQSADDIPISSTYHRVHSAEVAEQEKKWQEELRLQAEQREREVREYKAAMQIS